MKRTCLLTMLLALFFFSASVNAETAYEQEVSRIIRKYYSLVTYGYERGLSLEETYALEIYGQYAVRLKALDSYDLDRASLLISNMEQELKTARKYMTKEDYFREWKHSDIGKITTLLKNNMGETFQKDQFETQAQYEARVQEKLKASFDEWCQKAYGDMDNSLVVILTPKQYNAETQKYALEIKESYRVFDYEFENSFVTSVSILPQEARSLVETKFLVEDMSNVMWYLLDNSVLACMQVQFPSGVSLSIHKEGVELPLCFEFKNLQYSVPSLEKYKWCYTKVNELYDHWDAELQKDIEKINQEYISDPFNMKKEPLKLNYHLDKKNRFDYKVLLNEYNVKKQALNDTVKSRIAILKFQMRFNDVKQYIQIHEQLAPEEMNDAVRQMAQDYRCYNFSEQELKLAYIENRIPAGKTCKEKYIHLFKDEEEFQIFYSTASFAEEVARRELIENDYKEIEGFIDNSVKMGVKFNFIGCKNYNGDSTTPQGVAKRIVDYLSTSEIDVVHPTYSEQLIAQCFALDQNMAKEYEKNGALFRSKRVFFESYTSNNYKDDLKNAKKTK